MPSKHWHNILELSNPQDHESNKLLFLHKLLGLGYYVIETENGLISCSPYHSTAQPDLGTTALVTDFPSVVIHNGRHCGPDEWLVGRGTS